MALARVAKFLEHKTGFNSLTLGKLSLVSASEDGTVRFTLPVSSEHTNRAESLHGGLSATLLDVTSSMSLVAVNAPVGVSTDLSISYVGGAAIGENLEIEATIDRLGGTLAFTSARAWTIDSKGEKKLVWRGSHTKFIKGKTGQLSPPTASTATQN